MSSTNIQFNNAFVAVFILGGPGAGKGTQCAQLSQKYRNVVTLSTGALLRQFVKSGTKEAKEIAEQMREGKLVDIDATEQLLKPEFIKYQRQNSDKLLFIIDGFPRDLQILKDWQNGMKNEAIVPFMIEFVCDAQTMKQRLLKRQNSETVQRQDNNVKAIENRINLFENETQDVISVFKKLDKYVGIDATVCEEEVFKSLCQLIEPILNEINCDENALQNENNSADKPEIFTIVDKLAQSMSAVDLEAKINMSETSHDSDTDSNQSMTMSTTTTTMSSDIDSQCQESSSGSNLKPDLQYEQIKHNMKPMFVIL